MLRYMQVSITSPPSSCRITARDIFNQPSHFLIACSYKMISLKQENSHQPLTAVISAIKSKVIKCLSTCSWVVGTRKQQKPFSTFNTWPSLPSPVLYLCLCSCLALPMIWLVLSAVPKSVSVRLWSARGAQRHENTSPAELLQLVLRNDVFVDEVVLSGV